MLGHLGRFAEAYDCLDEAAEAMRHESVAGEASVLGWRSTVEIWQGRWEAALDSATRAYRLAERVSRLYILGMGEALAAYASWQLQRKPESLERIARSTSWLQARGQCLSISLNYGWLADMAADLARAGQATEGAARMWAARAIRRARRHDPFGEVMSYCALARLPWRGRGPTPVQHLELAFGRADENVRQPAADGGRGTALAPYRPRSPRELALAAWESGRQALRAGRGLEARTRLEQACGAFDALEMTWFADQAKLDLEAAPAAPDPAPRPPDPDREEHLVPR